MSVLHVETSTVKHLAEDSSLHGMLGVLFGCTSDPDGVRVFEKELPQLERE